VIQQLDNKSASCQSSPQLAQDFDYVALENSLQSAEREPSKDQESDGFRAYLREVNKDDSTPNISHMKEKVLSATPSVSHIPKPLEEIPRNMLQRQEPRRDPQRKEFPKGKPYVPLFKRMIEGQERRPQRIL